jgi:hypothetical protein
MQVRHHSGRRRIRRISIAIVPTAMIYFVSGLALFIGRAATQPHAGGISGIFSADCEVLPVATADPARIKQYAAYLNFTTLSALQLAVCVGAVLFVIVLLASLDLSRKRKAVLFLVAMLLAAPAMLITRQYPLLTPGLLRRHVAAICPAVSDLITRHQQANAFAAVLLAVTVSILLFFARGSVRGLALRMRQGNWVLHTATLLLIANVLRIDAMYQWAAMAEPSPEASAAMALLGSALTRLWGTYYTLLLAAVAISASAIFHVRVLRLVPFDLSDKLSDEWLREHGFSVTLPQLLPRVLAVFGPLLAGQATGLLSKLS